MSRFYRKIGSWLGLLAILMATLAPTVSQALAARAEHGAMHGEHCAMESMDGMASMGSMGSMPDLSSMHDADAQDPPQVSPSPDNPSSKHTQLSSGDACGYCSLLAHLPVMPGVGTSFVAALRARQHAVATRFERVRRVEPLTFAQPRAPPFIG